MTSRAHAPAPARRARAGPRARRAPRPLLALLGALALASACSQAPPSPERVTIVFLGDSLTAGYGLERSQAYPALVEERLRAAGWDVVAINAGISGHTTFDGLRRLAEVLEHGADVALVALGANDGLRQSSVGLMADNLGEIIERFRAAGTRVGLLGLHLPLPIPSMYRREFNAAWRQLADEHDVPLLEDLLADVLDDPARLLPDRLHPNADGQRIMAERVAAFLLDGDLLR